MDIKTSLLITENNLSRINLIITGAFVHVYNQSYYLLTDVLGKPLKPTIRNVKSLGNRLVISGGFPVYQVEKEFPSAIKTAWGYQLNNNFDATGYDDWLNQLKAQAFADLANSEVIASLPAIGEQQILAAPICQLITNNTITLNDKQLLFLVHWRQGVFHQDVEHHFIASIQKQITKQKAK